MDIEVLRSECISQYKRLIEKSKSNESVRDVNDFINNVNRITDASYLNNMLNEMRAEEDKLSKEASLTKPVSDSYRNDPDFIEGRFTIIARAENENWPHEKLVEKLTEYEQGWAASDVLPELKGNTK